MVFVLFECFIGRAMIDLRHKRPLYVFFVCVCLSIRDWMTRRRKFEMGFFKWNGRRRKMSSFNPHPIYVTDIQRQHFPREPRHTGHAHSHALTVLTHTNDNSQIFHAIGWKRKFFRFRVDHLRMASTGPEQSVFVGPSIS